MARNERTRKDTGTMSLFRNGQSSNSETIPVPDPPKYECSEPLATTENYKPSGSDDRHPMNDNQLSDMINNRES